MKYITIACLLLVLNLCSVHSNKQGRDFLTGLFTTIKGSTWSLDEKCLGKDFDNKVKTVIDNALNENWSEAYLGFLEIRTQMEDECPMNDIVALEQELADCYFADKCLTNVMKYSHDLVQLVKQELQMKDLSFFNAGTFIGKVMNIVVYNTDHSLVFLGDDVVVPFSSADVRVFLDGILEGSSTVPFTQNQCKQDIKDVRPQIESTILAVYQAVKTKQNIYSTLQQLYDLVWSLTKFNSHCNFVTFSANAISLSTKLGLGKLFLKIAMKPFKAYEAGKLFYTSITCGDFANAGIAVGRLLTVGFGWSTS